MSSIGIKVGGAWAALEYQQEEQKAVINELCSQVFTSLAACKPCVLSILIRTHIVTDTMQLTALQDAHQQLTQDYHQLRGTHSQQTDEFAQTVLELNQTNQELAEAKTKLDTSHFLRKVGQYIQQEALSQTLSLQNI